MKKMRIALGSNDGKDILLGHMGMAKHFYIFDLFEDGESTFLEKRENISPNEAEHGRADKLKACMEIFKDSDVVLGRKASPNFVKLRDNTKFQPVVTKVESISDSMVEIGKSFGEVYSLVERRRRGERPKEMPTIGKKSQGGI
jgi:hypothetical protein